MYVSKLFNRQKPDTASYRKVDETSVNLTIDEEKKVLQKALFEKIAKINSENYLKSLSNEPEYVIPSYHDLYESVIKELTEVHKWEIDQYNEPQIDMVCRYFANDPEFEKMGEGFSLQKGLGFFGPVGCGKTTLLEVVKKNSFNPFIIISCRKVADEYAMHGHDAIHYFSNLHQVIKREWYGHEKVGHCFDDLGTESVKKNFGNEVNVMTEVILNRYDNRDGRGKTHITTNLTGDQLKEIYGVRATSRLREIINPIEFPFDAPDRRK